MIQIVATFTIKVEKIAEAEKVMQSTIAPTRAEADNISYHLFKEIGKDNVYTYLEEWKSKESLNAHLATPHMQAFIEAINPLQIKPFDIQLLEKMD